MCPMCGVLFLNLICILRGLQHYWILGFWFSETSLFEKCLCASCFLYKLWLSVTIFRLLSLKFHVGSFYYLPCYYYCYYYYHYYYHRCFYFVRFTYLFSSQSVVPCMQSLTTISLPIQHVSKSTERFS
jgi:hypothetical protein